MGIILDFNEITLALRIIIKSNIRSTNIIDFRSNQYILSGKPVAPTKVSGHLNVYANQDYAFRDTVFGAKQGRLPLSASFDSAINVSNFVLEALGSYQEQSEESPWQRGDIRLVKDIPKKSLRFIAGDLNYKISTFQQFRSMGGLSLSKNFDLQPYVLTTPETRNEFFLKSDSDLQIYINDRPYQKMRLAAGTYDVRNLPLGSGLNQVRYEIIDPSGKTESIQLPFNADPDNLRKNLSQYSYNAGFASKQERSTYSYDSNKFSASAFHRYGFSDVFTGGFSYQGDRIQNLETLEALLATNAGSFGFDVAYSNIRKTVSDYAGRFRYSYKDYYGSSNTPRAFLLSAESRGRYFAPLGVTNPNNAAAYIFSTNYNQQIIGNLGGGIGADYTVNRSTATALVNSYRTNYILSRSWRSGFSGSLIASIGKNSLGNKEKSLFFFLSWQIPDSGHNISYTQSTQTSSNRIDWRYTPISRSSRYSINAAAEENVDAKSVESQLDYKGSRGEILLSQQSINTRLGDRRFIGKLRVATALVFAENTLGVSRPVSDSFAMVVRPSSWHNENIDINPDADGYYDAQINNFGPAIVPSLTSYTYPRLHADGSKLAAGLSLGPETFQLSPTYKSGTLIEIGSDATVAGYGSLVDKEGKAIALIVAEIYFLDHPEQESLEIFTNKEGAFQIEGLKPGKYEIRSPRALRKPLQFNIPENTKGLFNIGILQGARN